MSRKKKIIILVIVLAGALIGWRMLGSQQSTEAEAVNADHGVTLSSVADLSLNSSPLPLLGTVVSRSEADIKAESSGKLVSVSKKLGDHVEAGEIIAQFDNSAERAALLSAQGAYEAAKSGQGIAQINRGSADQSLNEAKTQSLNAIYAAYTVLDDAVRTKTDPAFREPQTRNAKLIASIADEKLMMTIESEHINAEIMLTQREAKNRTLGIQSDLIAELSVVESEVNMTKNYLDDLSSGFNKAIPDQNSSASTIDGLKTSTALARAAVNGALASITASRNILNASIAANAVAEKNFSQTSLSQNAGSDATLKSALGALEGAESRLEKTIIRSPIQGSINSLSVQTGDFVSPFGEIAIVSNNGALEVLAYATDDDAKVLRVGGKVSINDTTKGVITRIASALDPKTKKIEVRIGITGSTHDLINGQSVRINATRALASTLKKDAIIQIPLSALKITPTGSVVFTVSASSTLVAHPVKEGALLGEEIVITEGLTPDMLIVTDARGLKDGAAVTVTK